MAGLMDYVDAMLGYPDVPGTLAQPQVDFTPDVIRRFDNMAMDQGLVDVSPFFLPGPKVGKRVQTRLVPEDFRNVPINSDAILDLGYGVRGASKGFNKELSKYHLARELGKEYWIPGQLHYDRFPFAETLVDAAESTLMNKAFGPVNWTMYNLEKNYDDYNERYGR
jgi:hypothetical protein